MYDLQKKVNISVMDLARQTKARVLSEYSAQERSVSIVSRAGQGKGHPAELMEVSEEEIKDLFERYDFLDPRVTA